LSGLLRWQELERGAPPEQCVTRLVDHPHAPLAEAPEQRILAELRCFPDPLSQTVDGVRSDRGDDQADVAPPRRDESLHERRRQAAEGEPVVKDVRPDRDAQPGDHPERRPELGTRTARAISTCPTPMTCS